MIAYGCSDKKFWDKSRIMETLQDIIMDIFSAIEKDETLSNNIYCEVCGVAKDLVFVVYTPDHIVAKISPAPTIPLYYVISLCIHHAIKHGMTPKDVNGGTFFYQTKMSKVIDDKIKYFIKGEYHKHRTIPEIR